MTIAFVFPGQGSHRAGMASVWDGHDAAEVFDVVAEATGLELHALADDADECAATAVGQPAIFAASLAAYRALTDAGITPDVVAGHSLGEISAAVASGAIALADGARLVGERGAAMGEACATNPGTMAAVLKLDGDAVAEILEQVPAVALANENAVGQAVLSGPPDAIEEAVALAREAGGRVLPLDVEGAFHSEAMAPALVRVKAVVEVLTVGDTEIPLVTGTSGEVLEDGARIASAIVDGLLSPVRWRVVQERLATLGVDTVVEVGPGGVLRGIARRSLPDATSFAVRGPDDIAAVRDHLAAASSTAGDRA